VLVLLRIIRAATRADSSSVRRRPRERPCSTSARERCGDSSSTGIASERAPTPGSRPRRTPRL